MPTTYTIHTVDCPSAADAPLVAASDYPTPPARKHRCIYHADPLPDEIRVTHVDEVVP